MRHRLFDNKLLLAIIGAITCFILRKADRVESCFAATEKPATAAASLIDEQRLEQREPAPLEEARLFDAARRLKHGIVVLGTPNHVRGVGFVISRKHRLIATAAHVADFVVNDGGMFAVPDDTDTVYRVGRVWYHPGLSRKLDDGLYARSHNPMDGKVRVHPSLDLAILQLSQSGPELLMEYQLAGEDELRDLDALPVGLRSYTDGKGNSWPIAGRPAPTRFTTSVIRAPISTTERTEARFKDYVYCTVDSSDGASGSPMFLANGHVVAVTTSGTSFSEQSRELRGLRIDCLDELLAYHALDGSMSRTGKRAKPRPDSGPDPRLGHLRQAVRLVREADALRRSGKYRSAAEKCEQALLLAPDYGGALLQRGKVYLYYLGTHWQELTAEERGRYALFAYQDSNRCEVMFPEWNEAWLVHGQNIIYVARLNSLPKGFQNARAKLEEMLGRDWPNPLTDSERSYAFNLRAQCHNFLGDMEQAEKDYAESILLAPDEPRWYLNRAQFWEQQGRPQLEKADREKAQALRRKRITASAQE